MPLQDFFIFLNAKIANQNINCRKAKKKKKKIDERRLIGSIIHEEKCLEIKSCWADRRRERRAARANEITPAPLILEQRPHSDDANRRPVRFLGYVLIQWSFTATSALTSAIFSQSGAGAQLGDTQLADTRLGAALRPGRPRSAAVLMRRARTLTSRSSADNNSAHEPTIKTSADVVRERAGVARLASEAFPRVKPRT
ncbi:hypothetical protein EVAR_25271_1 [Eumeta japonica]|uniref:Uncharacterized protein n=1 Tax=Eumeta variegata TaxID=151549 RepID=A0A4C1VQF0_EUMVA|nr:hypothetical protein EVAR_25271_1 [Eumeta japonica]